MSHQSPILTYSTQPLPGRVQRIEDGGGITLRVPPPGPWRMIQGLWFRLLMVAVVVGSIVGALFARQDGLAYGVFVGAIAGLMAASLGILQNTFSPQTILFELRGGQLTVTRVAGRDREEHRPK